MTQQAYGLTLFAALITFAMPLSAAAQQDYLYVPRPVDTAANQQQGAGEILVREIKVKKGDTLSRLSRQFSGKGHYYPQILLFNEIKNPHLIHVGQTVRVPIKQVQGASAAFREPIKPKSENVAKAKATPKKQPAVSRPASVESPVPAVRASQDRGAAVAVVDAQQLLDNGAKAYRSGDCRAAIAFYDRVLSDFAASSQAAEAGLYRADCLLRLSGQ